MELSVPALHLVRSTMALQLLGASLLRSRLYPGLLHLRLCRLTRLRLPPVLKASLFLYVPMLGPLELAELSPDRRLVEVIPLQAQSMLLLLPTLPF